MVKRFELSTMGERLKFDVRLQVSLRSNAINIMKHYEDKDRFMKYIDEREEKIRILLNCDENPIITEKGKEIFP